MPVTLTGGMRDALHALDHVVEWHDYPMAHAICMDEAADLKLAAVGGIGVCAAVWGPVFAAPALLQPVAVQVLRFNFEARGWGLRFMGMSVSASQGV